MDIKLIHKVVGLLFLLIYVVKTLLLLMNKTEQLARFIKKTKVPEMIVSFLFLVTGGYMLMQKDQISSFMIIKLIAVFASIPIAVMAFKKANKILAVLSLLLIIAAYGLAEVGKKREMTAGAEKLSSSTTVDGKELYSAYCSRCHGDDGKLGGSGATDLSVSVMERGACVEIITAGKGMMTGFRGQLSDEQVNAVADHIATLRTGGH